MLFTGTLEIKLNGFVFERLDQVIHKAEINNWEQLTSFLGCYGLQAYENKQNCALMNEKNEVVFYMQNGEVIFDSNSNQNWDNLFKIMKEG